VTHRYFARLIRVGKTCSKILIVYEVDGSEVSARSQSRVIQMITYKCLARAHVRLRTHARARRTIALASARTRA
jgi:hypothetical protein